MKDINQDYFLGLNNGTIVGKQFANQKRIADLVKRERDLQDIEEIIIHCNAVPVSAEEGWELPTAEINYATHPNHINRTLGSPSASYHFLVNLKGDIFQTVSMNIWTDHCTGHNKIGVAVCINHDGFTKTQITDEMYQSLVDTVCYIFDKLDWDYSMETIEDRLHFHRDYANKECPGQLSKLTLQQDVCERLKTWGDNN